jgi:hypothetical protein
MQIHNINRPRLSNNGKVHFLSYGGMGVLAIHSGETGNRRNRIGERGNRRTGIHRPKRVEDFG